MDRKIIHIDMDCFYASVEIRDRPELKDLPVAVGGSPEGRGVVTTANYVARRYGVRSAMSSRQALKLCPKLILLPPRFSQYKAESRRIREIFKEYTEVIEPLSLDEAYLDVTQCPHAEGSATRMAEQIRARIFAETQLTASAGIAPNKFLAKVASDWNKPDGQFTIRPKDIGAFMKSLPVEKIPGVGKVTARKMKLKGLNTCGDLQKLSQLELMRQFGAWGASLFEYAHGRDERPVCSRSVRKSFSVENTFSEDLREEHEIVFALNEIYQDFVKRWQKSGIPSEEIKGHFVKIKFFDFKQTTHARAQVGFPLFPQFEQLLRHRWTEIPRPIRLLGVGVNLKEPHDKKLDFDQMTLF